jgi:hypothetical protein
MFEVHEGSDELSTAWSLLKDQYNFIDVSNSSVIELNPDRHIHFLLLEPKNSMKQIIQDLKNGHTILEEVPAPLVRRGHVLIKHAAAW